MDAFGSLTLTPFYEGDDAELKVTLKKLSKKDSLTKLKALSEIEIMFNERDVETLKEAASHWYEYSLCIACVYGVSSMYLPVYNMYLLYTYIYIYNTYIYLYIYI